METKLQSSVFVSFLVISITLAHSNPHHSVGGFNNAKSPLFGNVMKYFGESETGYGLPSSGLFDDVDLPTQQQVAGCLPNFEVSVGSIILTNASQTLGAHYLNYTDLGVKGRDECLRLCCKVPQCNVAVFEEKNTGSCYLFDCNSLEDFRCKFTSQSHFVSAILRRRDVIVTQQQRSSPERSSNDGSIMGAHTKSHAHNQHEDELSQLRESDKMAAAALIGARIQAAAVSSGASNNLDGKGKQTGNTGSETVHGVSGGNGAKASSSTLSPVGGAFDGSTDSHRCSRWQFECKSSGECIAIYNVCDQIPNCPDGSDESPELQCPAPGAAYSGAGVGGDASLAKLKGSSSAVMTAGISHPQSQAQSPSQQLHHPQPPVPINGALEKVPGLVGSSSNSHGVSTGIGMKNQGPLRQTEEYAPNSPKLVDGNGGMINIPRKNEQSSNIFSHKDGGIIEEAFGNHPQSQAMHNNYGPFWKQPNYDYGNGDSQTGNLYGPLPPPPPPPPQYSNNGLTYGSGANYGSSPYQFNGYQNIPASPQQSASQGIPLLPQGQPQYNLPNTNYNLQPAHPPQQQNPQPSQHLYYNNQQQQLQPSNINMVPLYNQPNVVQQPNNNAVVSGANPINPSIQQGTMPRTSTTNKPSPSVQQGAPKSGSNNTSSSVSKDSLSKLESEFLKSLKSQSLQGSDLESDELSPQIAGAGAVFIFILGLGMSIVMVIIIGCRLRRVGRRQRGKNRLDPDYLVDGMYL